MWTYPGFAQFALLSEHAEVSVVCCRTKQRLSQRSLFPWLGCKNVFSDLLWLLWVHSVMVQSDQKWVYIVEVLVVYHTWPIWSDHWHLHKHRVGLMGLPAHFTPAHDRSVFFMEPWMIDWLSHCVSSLTSDCRQKSVCGVRGNLCQLFL